MKEYLQALDGVMLNFSPTSLNIMNIVIAFIMFGVALQLKFDDFKKVLMKPKGLILGALSQFVFLPVVTFLLVLLLQPTTSVALGMILVAACPGGNISNFISSLSRANVGLSVSLTAVSTFLSVIMTPFNFWLWGSLYLSQDVEHISIDFMEMLRTVIILLGIPVFAGILCAKYFPKIVRKAKKPISLISIVAFAAFVVLAFAGNFNNFLKYIHLIILIVFIHNTIAFLTGYTTAKLGKLDESGVRSITIETGIQNSGLGLILIFNPHLFVNIDKGGMAFIAAWWGIWHIVAGMVLAFYWRHKTRRRAYRK